MCGPGRAPIFAGLATRDLRAWGGHEVVALAALAQSSRDARVALLHVGGELLTCTAWEAAVMLAHLEDAQSLIASRHCTSADARSAYARATLASMRTRRMLSGARRSRARRISV